MRLLILLLLAPAALAASGDGDGDGVLDGADACPTVAEDLDGYQDADGCPDPDNDADGVPDTQDKCPSDPEDIDGFQDMDGCPDHDNDDDGLADAVDPCPDAAGERGCPADTDALTVPFSKLTRAIAMGDLASAEHAFTPEGWTDNVVGPGGLRGARIYEQGLRSGWSLVPTAPPLMVGPGTATVPCAVRLLADGRDLEQVHALVVQTDAGWRIHGVSEQKAAIDAAASRRAVPVTAPDLPTE